MILEQAFQQTRLLVDEAGTVAASLTEAALMRGAAPREPRKTKRFICDHPYVLRVVDLDSGAAVFEAAATAAEAGAAATEPLRATKGRASYLGERSIGHLDPGAVSTSLILRAAARAAGEASAA